VGQDARPGDGLTFSGRVVELETGKPVEGAAVILDRSIRGADPRALPPWAGETTVRTDVDGRFQLSFPPEQLSQRQASIMLRIRHPGFIARRSQRVLLAEVIRGKARGEILCQRAVFRHESLTVSSQRCV
jgi:protocatechuate 3,4-dioxygenase beta subunit